MEIKQLQSKVSKIFSSNLKRDHIKPSQDYLVMKLTEEMGEFVQSLLVHQKRCRPVKCMATRKSRIGVSKELADVLGILFVIAQTMHIDLEEAVVKKWITKEWIKNP